MKLNKESQTRLLLLAALFVSCLFIFRSYLFGDSVLVFDDVGGDTWQQYTMHYASIVNHLRAGEFFPVGFHQWNGNQYVFPESF